MRNFICIECDPESPCRCSFIDPDGIELYPDHCLFTETTADAKWVEDYSRMREKACIDFSSGIKVYCSKCKFYEQKALGDEALEKLLKCGGMIRKPIDLCRHPYLTTCVPDGFQLKRCDEENIHNGCIRFEMK